MVRAMAMAMVMAMAMARARARARGSMRPIYTKPPTPSQVQAQVQVSESGFKRGSRERAMSTHLERCTREEGSQNRHASDIGVGMYARNMHVCAHARMHACM